MFVNKMSIRVDGQYFAKKCNLSVRVKIIEYVMMALIHSHYLHLLSTLYDYQLHHARLNHPFCAHMRGTFFFSKKNYV